MPTILVIDDSPSALALAELILAEDGHQVIPFLSAIEAMELAARVPVDVIVTDLYMPEKDGLEVLQEVRKVCPKVPVIAVSGVRGVKNMLSAAKILGADCILQKPYSKEQLLGSVAGVLGSSAKAELPALGGSA